MLAGGRLAGAGLVLVSGTAFGSLAVLVKVGNDIGLTRDQMLSLRFVIAAVGLCLLTLRFDRGAKGQRFVLFPWLVVMGLLFMAQTLLFFEVLKSLPASLAELLLFTFPCFVALGGWLVYRRPITRRVALALVTSMVGLVVLVGGADFTGDSAIFLALIVPVLYAIYLIIGERVMRQVSPLTASSTVMVVGAVGFTVVALGSGTLSLPDTRDGWAVVLGLAVVPMIGLPTLLMGLERLDATSTAILSVWEPVVTVIMAVLILGEELTLGRLIGGTLVVVSICVVQIGSRRDEVRLDGVV